MKFIRTDVALAIHEIAIREHGGPTGIRDKGLLESALARPKNLNNYKKKKTVHELAASYCYSIVKNHPFVDGNKRVGAIVMGLFLMKNGWELKASEKELVLKILGIAEGGIAEKDLAVWVKENSRKVKK